MRRSPLVLWIVPWAERTRPPSWLHHPHGRHPGTASRAGHSGDQSGERGTGGIHRAATLEAPRGIRVNVVSPPWVTETLQAMGRSLEGGLPASVVAKAYVRSVEGKETGEVLSPSDGDAGRDRDGEDMLVRAGSGERR